MKNLLAKLIVYRMEDDSIISSLAEVLQACDECIDYAKSEGEGEIHPATKSMLVSDITCEIHNLLDLATEYGFENNLWQDYLAYILATTETPFTLVSEKHGAVDGSVNEFVKNDIAIIKELIDFDFSKYEELLGINCFSVIKNYTAVKKKERIYNREVSEKVRELSDAFAKEKDTDKLLSILSEFYRKYGVGKLGLNKAFRVRSGGGELLAPINFTGSVVLDDLVGYEEQKRLLKENTEAFIAGRPANNVLLYGDAGTGKSTSVKAILNEYYKDGLRMVEIYKHQCKYLSRVIDEVKDRNYKFIIFMDDLSFEEFETDYKYLKAVIEGGLEPRPDNVLIYATSNRRHLIRETWKDKGDIDSDDLHRNDTVSEKLSLADRFGVNIGYFRPRPAEYLNIVKELAKKSGKIKMSDEELSAKASTWAIRHGGYSGRTAKQFVDNLLGAEEKDED